MKIETKKPLFSGKLMASLASAMIKPEVKIFIKKKVVPHTCIKRIFPAGTEDLIDFKVEDVTAGASVAEVRKKFEEMDKLLVKTAAGKDFVMQQKIAYQLKNVLLGLGDNNWMRKVSKYECDRNSVDWNGY